MEPPVHPIDQLILSCRNDRKKVVIWDVAVEGAETFKIVGRDAIKNFIGNETLIGLVHKSTDDLDTWKGAPPAPIVEAYIFQLGSRYVYFAYFFIEKTKMWTIKSFKENESEKQMVRSLDAISRIALKSTPFKDNEKLRKFLASIQDKKGTEGNENE